MMIRKIILIFAVITGYINNAYSQEDAGYAGSFLRMGLGARARALGDAYVSDKHANFIINKGAATAREVRELIAVIKQKVLEQFDIVLEEEIQYLGDY